MDTTPEAFQAMAEAAYARLPARFRDMCGDLVVRVADYADGDTLDALGIGHPLDLLGLYHGVSLNHKSTQDLPIGPDMVMLYREPILAYWRDHEDSLEAIVAHVLIHEIGHHFGLSDADMERIESEAR